ncbi:MAG: pyridoxal-phosphate dependent enzyme, partial [Bellilinea sp.]
PELPTLAEGVRVRTPVRARALLDQIQRSQGIFVSILEDGIRDAHRSLCRRGYYVEPTSAIVWAAFKDLYLELKQPVVAVLSGNGLKYTLAS